MKIESFQNAHYLPNVNGTENRMVCTWKFEEVELKLIESKVVGQSWLDLFVCSELVLPMRIALNNGTKEILMEANPQNPKLLEIIRDHNPDIESKLDGHSLLGKHVLEASIPQATTTVTKPIRL